MTNSRRKGARGELEWVNVLKKHGFKARRGQQYKGTPDSPDVICEDLPIHWEVKRRQNLNIFEALEQATSEAPEGSFPVVVWKKNLKRWIVCLDAETFLRGLETCEE